MSYNIPAELADLITGAPNEQMKVVAPGPAPAGTPEANGSWVAPFRTITEAIAALPVYDAGDPTTWIQTLWVYPGIYDESITISTAGVFNIYTLGTVFLGDPSSIGGPGGDITFNVPNGSAPPINQSTLNIRSYGTPGPHLGGTSFSGMFIAGNITFTGEPAWPPAPGADYGRKLTLAESVVFGSIVGDTAPLGKVILNLVNAGLQGDILLPHVDTPYEIYIATGGFLSNYTSDIICAAPYEANRNLPGWSTLSVFDSRMLINSIDAPAAGGVVLNNAIIYAKDFISIGEMAQIITSSLGGDVTINEDGSSRFMTASSFVGREPPALPGTLTLGGALSLNIDSTSNALIKAYITKGELVLAGLGYFTVFSDPNPPP